MKDREQTLIFDEAYLADLLTEELCGDGSPLADSRVKSIAADGDGRFRLGLVLRDETAK